MKLVKVQVKFFRNILDSTEVIIQDDVTCLVGKNESGKTAFLHALYRLNPARPNVSFSVPDQYPAWLEKRDRHRGVDLESVKPVRAIFKIEDADRAKIEERFGIGVIESEEIIVEREYGGNLVITLEADEKKSVLHVIKQAENSKQIFKKSENLSTFHDLYEFIEELKASEASEDKQKGNQELAAEIKGHISKMLGKDDFQTAVKNAIDGLIPKFFYYAEYSSLPASVKIRELLNSDKASLSDDDHTALSLLRLAATDDDYLLNPDYERRKRELENVANAITLDVLKYWSQNPELRVVIDISQKNIKNPQGQIQSVLDELKVRIWDERHWLSLPFDEHSTGFRWFFSFLAAFSKYEWSDSPLIILLDEPALGLHARAQKDFLRFIDERLASKRQVIHTTHSPFMVQPDKLERVRIVEDKGREDGAQISADVLILQRLFL